MHDYDSAVARFGSSLALGDGAEIESECCLKFSNDSVGAPLITVGIPVYNGYLSINRTLKSVYASLIKLADANKVEIVICDNASADKTGEAIQEFFKEKLVRGGYFRHQVNIGFDLNLDSIVKFSTGRYVWFLGCGDEIKSDALSRLLEKLEQLNVSNVLLDFDRYSEADTTIIQKSEHAAPFDLIVNGRDDFSHSRYAPALSANIVLRELWQRCQSAKFITSGWGHVERILRILSLNENSKTAILVGPYFTLFVDKKGWWTKADGYKLHLEHIKLIMSMSTMGFQASAVNQRLRELNGLVLIRSVIGARKYGYVFSASDLREIQGCSRFGIFSLIMIGLHMPLPLASFIFSESKRKAIRLGLRKLARKTFVGSK